VLTRTRIVVFLIVAGLCAPVECVRGEEWERHSILTDTWRLSLGSFFQTADSTLSVEGSGMVDTTSEINFERALGLSKHDNRPSGQVVWRFGKKWSLALQYLDREGSASVELSEDLPWEGDFIRAGLDATGGVSSKVYRVFLGRRFSEGPKHEFGAGLGVHWLEIGAFLEGEFTLDDDSLVSERRRVSAGAPLPNIGAWYIYAFSPRWAGHARLDYLSASFNEYSGGLTNAAVGVTFQAWRHVALGLDYNYFKLDVDVDSGNWFGSADFKRDGPFLHLTFTW
jgi:hypothetical protein